MTAMLYRPGVETKLYVYVDGGASDLSGRLYNFANEQKDYAGLTDLLLKAESLFDAHACPQAFFSGRSFAGAPEDQFTLHTKEEKPPMQQNEAESHEVTADFIIHVRQRQNATWQGDITRVDEGKTKRFNSGLEMIRLLDHAIQQQTGAKESTDWE